MCAQAALYSDYFENLDPVLDAAAAGLQVTRVYIRCKSGEKQV